MRIKNKLILVLTGIFLFAGSAAGLVSAASDVDYEISYDFSSSNQLADFTATIDPEANSDELGYTSDAWVTYIKQSAEDLWAYNADEETIISRRDKMSGDNITGNLVSLLYNQRQFKYFELETKISHADATNGWGGIVFGVQDFTRQPSYSENPNGGLFFVQGDGKPTYKHISGGNDWKEATAITDFNGMQEHTYKLKIYQGKMQFYVDGINRFDIDIAQDQLSLGNIGIFATNKAIRFSSLQINPLNEDGTIELPQVVSLEVENPTSAAIAGDKINVNALILPQGAANKGYSLAVSPNKGAHVSGTSIVFKDVGVYTVTATSDNNAAAKDSFEITVSEKDYSGYISLPFTEDGMKNFEVADVADSNNGSIVKDYKGLFKIEDGVLTRTVTAEQTDVSSNYGVLYFKNRQTKNFEVMFQAKTSEKNGWFGIFFAKTNKTNPGNQEGESLFMQTSSRQATSWGAKLGGPSGNEFKVESFRHNEYSLFKFRVFGVGETLKVEMYVDDFTTPYISKNIASAEGAIGLFASTCETSFKNMYFAMLDEQGKIIPYIPVESVTVSGKTVAGEVGDKFSVTAS